MQAFSSTAATLALLSAMLPYAARALPSSAQSAPTYHAPSCSPVPASADVWSLVTSADPTGFARDFCGPNFKTMSTASCRHDADVYISSSDSFCPWYWQTYSHSAHMAANYNVSLAPGSSYFEIDAVTCQIAYERVVVACQLGGSVVVDAGQGRSASFAWSPHAYDD